MSHQWRPKVEEVGDQRIHVSQVVPLAEMHPAEYNPHLIETENYENLQRSLDDAGNLGVIVLNDRMHKGWNGKVGAGTLTIVGGHKRRNAELALGHTHAAAYIISVGPKREKKLNVRLNSKGNQGYFDEAGLERLIKEFDQPADELATEIDMDAAHLEYLLKGRPKPEEDEKPAKKKPEKKYTIDQIWEMWRDYGLDMAVFEEFQQIARERG
jgi:hypothetical protein